MWVPNWYPCNNRDSKPLVSFWNLSYAISYSYCKGLYYLISLILRYNIPFSEDRASFTLILSPMMMRGTFCNPFCRSGIVIAKKAVLSVLFKTNKQKNNQKTPPPCPQNKFTSWTYTNFTIVNSFGISFLIPPKVPQRCQHISVGIFMTLCSLHCMVVIIFL